MSCQSVCVSLHTGMMLKGNTTLKRLNLRECGLEPEGLEEVMKGVEVNTKLEILDLEKNIIDNKRASCLVGVYMCGVARNCGCLDVWSGKGL